jgi:hypothetical protein
LPRAVPILLALTVCFSVSATAHAEERFALVVGANEGGRGAGALYFAELDAERVADVLESLGGIPRDQIILLRSPTRAGFDGAMARLSARVAEGEATGDGHTTVFFYFSGHADPDAMQLG